METQVINILIKEPLSIGYKSFLGKYEYPPPWQQMTLQTLKVGLCNWYWLFLLLEYYLT